MNDSSSDRKISFVQFHSVNVKEMGHILQDQEQPTAEIKGIFRVS